MVGHNAHDILVVGQCIDRSRVIAAEVSDLPTAGNGDAIEERNVGNHIANASDSTCAKRGDERGKDRITIERPATA